jgi:hypothetical protein
LAVFLQSKNILFKNKEMNVTTMVMEAYEAPKVVLIEVEVEKGFAGSGSTIESIEGRNEELDW